MSLRSPTLATISTFIYLTLLLCLQSVFARADTTTPHNTTNSPLRQLICEPFGPCAPCPEEALKQPYCQPFGNRRLMHCSNITVPSNNNVPPGPLDNNSSPESTKQEHPDGETPAWEACGRIVNQERADFFEFIACNVLFAIVSLAVLFTRSQRLQAMHARQLAARIGLIRNTVEARR